MAAKKNVAKSTSPSTATIAKTASAKSKPGSSGENQSAFDLLKAQHKDLRVRAQKLAKQFGQRLNVQKRAAQKQKQNGNGQAHENQGIGASGNGQEAAEKDQSLTQDLKALCAAWIRHSRLEEDLVFPALEEAGVNVALLEQAEVQRDLVILLLDDMVSRDADDTLMHGEAALFCEMVPRLARFEESRLFPAAKQGGLDAAELGRQMRRAGGTEEEGDSDHQAEDFNEIPRPRHLRGVETSSKEYVTMPMRGQERDRDERGRFMDEDDHRGRGRGGSSSRSSSSGSRGGGRYDDDNDGRGWHGDPRGHSEASRRGWEERRGSSSSSGRSRYEDDEDDRHSSRGRSSGMSRSSSSGGGGRRSGGWFGDSEGHSEASRRGWDNPNHGESGWFGDRDGHSEASRRGWQSPDHGESGWFGDREGHSQASRRGWDNPNHGDSGWFGDPEGHSEASRRGWRTRRDEDDDYDDRRRSRRGRD